MMRGNRVAIDISPLCGDDSVHTVQRTNRGTFEAKPHGWSDKVRKKMFRPTVELTRPRRHWVVSRITFDEKVASRGSGPTIHAQRSRSVALIGMATKDFRFRSVATC